MAEDFPRFSTSKNPENLQGESGDSCKSWESLQILSQHFILPKKTKACSRKILPFTWVGPNVIFEERLNGKFSEIAVEFNFEGGRANLANPTNFSGYLPDSPDSTRSRKLEAKIPL